MRRIGLATTAMLVLTGCGQDGDQAQIHEAVDVELIAPPTMEGAPTGGAASAPATPPASIPVSVPRVAYVYRYGLELPSDRAPILLNQHEQACIAAGAATCQVIGSESTRYGRDDLSARLTMRATPTYVARFRGGLAGEAEAAGGRVASSTTESEDLTRQLIDSEARQRALTTLRDRLQQLLATRSGSLEELLKVESELARVQGEIDATQSTLAEMRTRVATSRLEIEYHAAGQLAPDSAFRPVTNALDGALSAFMATLGALITLLAVLLPIAIIAVPLAWWVLKRRKAGKAKKASAKSSVKPQP